MSYALFSQRIREYYCGVMSKLDRKTNTHYDITFMHSPEITKAQTFETLEQCVAQCTELENFYAWYGLEAVAAS